MLILKNVKIVNFYPPSVSKETDILIDDDKIIGVGKNISQNFAGENIIDLSCKYISPGLVCSHNHFYSTLARGILADIKPSNNFTGILKNLWWKLDKAIDEEILYYSSLVGALESIKAGTTSVVDHNSSPSFINGSLNVLKKGFEKTGLRGILCYEITDRNGKADALKGIEESIDFINEIRQTKHPANLIEAAVGAHASFTLSDETLSLISEIITETGKGIHIHAGEDKFDEEYSKQKFGKSVIKRLNDFNLLNDKSILAHGVHLSLNEIKIINENDSFIVHNPRSNMNNSVGYLNNLHRIKNVAIGTDGIGSNMFEETKFAFFKNNDAKVKLPLEDFLKYLQNGNLILQCYFNSKFGKIEKGYKADMVVYDYNPSTPIINKNLAGHFVFGFSSRDVETVIINGKIVYENRSFPFDVNPIYSEARKAAAKLWKRMDKII